MENLYKSMQHTVMQVQGSSFQVYPPVLKIDGSKTSPILVCIFGWNLDLYVAFITVMILLLLHISNIWQKLQINLFHKQQVM